MSLNLLSIRPKVVTPCSSCQAGRLSPLWRVASVILLLAAGSVTSAAEPAVKPADEALEAAGEHLGRGRYAEALEAYRALTGLTGEAEIAAARGTARCLVETGQLEEARKILETAIKAHPRSARLRADLALLQLQRGLFEEARKSIEAALQRDADDPLARLAEARLLTETGQLQEAGNAWRWFVRYYNRVQPTGAEELLAVGEGALQYARWNSVSQIFGFVLNTLCTDALKDDPDAWQALSLSGELLLEKHNRAEALPEFRKALAINPRAAAVQVWLARAALDQQETAEAERLAELALKINPAYVPALHIQADLAFARGALPEADRILQQAAEVNPHSQQTLARMAAIHVLLGHPPAGQVEGLLEQIEKIGEYQGNRKGRFAEITIQVAERNPRPGVYLTEIGTALESRRQYFAAEQFYRAAMRVMPQLAEPKTALGMLYMRIGRTDEARTILDDAFKADPYHVRVSNMRKVLKVLGDYDRIATEHFIVHVDQERDRILGEYMAEYLEEIYPELVREFGFEPPARTHFEIYSTARGLSGHQWFSARMIGLPWIQTIGASTGVIVALTSPAESQKPFNWARVLRHEFVHVITLQQTQFHIPHWFTEALAVRSEGYPRPDEWNRLLLARVPQGDLRTLENLSQGFTSPKSPEDWQFAYCQSRLYAEYMTTLAGAESLSRMLAAYRQNHPTEKAVQDVFGIDIEQFEAGYRKYLEDLTAELKSGRGTNLDGLDLEETRAAFVQN
ncbi:MAG: tetratricopeptide repeat protein, partial [Planctomycetaceae bacterium]|nr:tetratricopeptide repeat protein [Planctomycetaceae bacterium]